MKKFSPLVFCLILFVSSSFAQSSIELKDEFGRTNLEDMMARLDIFAYSHLSNNPENKLLIRIEGGTDRWFAYPFMQGAIMKAYLTNMRKVPGEQVLVQYCEIGDVEIRKQLFLVPPGAKVESCNEQITLPKQTKYFSGFSENPYNNFDEKNDGCCYIEGAGEAVSKIEDEILLKLVSQNPEMKIYLIGYAGHFTISKEKQTKNGKWTTEEKTKADSKNIIDKLLKKEKARLEKMGIDSSKIFTIKGGYMEDQRSVKLFLVPKDGEIPKPEPDYFPKKK